MERYITFFYYGKIFYIFQINGVDWGLYNSNFIASSGDDKTLLIWDYN